MVMHVTYEQKTDQEPDFKVRQLDVYMGLHIGNQLCGIVTYITIII